MLRAPPLLSFLQGLSAPVRLRFDYSPTELARLARIERDHGQPPGWWATLTAGQRASLLALYRVEAERHGSGRP